MQLTPGIYLLGALGPDYTSLVASGLFMVIIRGVDMYVHSGLGTRLARLTRRIETNLGWFVASMTVTLTALGIVVGSLDGNVLGYAARALLFGLISGVVAFQVLEPTEYPAAEQVPDSA